MRSGVTGDQISTGEQKGTHCRRGGQISNLSPGSSCGLVAYTLRLLAQWYTFFIQLSFG